MTVSVSSAPPCLIRSTTYLCVAPSTLIPFLHEHKMRGRSRKFRIIKAQLCYWQQNSLEFSQLPQWSIRRVFQYWSFIFERARPFLFCKGHFHWKIFKSIGNFCAWGTKAKTRATEANACVAFMKYQAWVSIFIMQIVSAVTTFKLPLHCFRKFHLVILII